MDIPANRDEIQHVQTSNISENEYETDITFKKVEKEKMYLQKLVSMSPQS